jgi:hypothetical protein
MTKNVQAPGKDVVCHEFQPVGKYRIRLIKTDLSGPVLLDVREYVSGEDFQGFTRRGIRISDQKDMKTLRDHLDTALRMLEVKS